MKLAYLRWVAPAIIGITLSGPAFGAASLPTKPAPAATTPAPSSAPATTAPAPSAGQVASYAEREQANQNLQNFRGGATLVIGGSVLVLALLIVIILLLI